MQLAGLFLIKDPPTSPHFPVTFWREWSESAFSPFSPPPPPSHLQEERGRRKGPSYPPSLLFLFSLCALWMQKERVGGDPLSLWCWQKTAGRGRVPPTHFSRNSFGWSSAHCKGESEVCPFCGKWLKICQRTYSRKTHSKEGKVKDIKEGKRKEKSDARLWSYCQGCQSKHKYIWKKRFISSKSKLFIQRKTYSNLLYYVWQLCLLNSSPSAPFPARTVAEREWGKAHFYAPDDVMAGISAKSPPLFIFFPKWHLFFLGFFFLRKENFTWCGKCWRSQILSLHVRLRRKRCNKEVAVRFLGYIVFRLTPVALFFPTEKPIECQLHFSHHGGSIISPWDPPTIIAIVIAAIKNRGFPPRIST